MTEAHRGPDQAKRPRKVAIVGGGCAAMAAAWDLTEPEQQENPCEVTIFQIGGRLGGKGASSRNRERGDRIEEHGLHLWLGYYENAFRMVRSCFEELKKKERTGADAFTDENPVPEHMQAARPFNDWDWRSAFERASLVGLADESSGDWVPWVARFPEYVLKSENGVTGLYTSPDGTPLPGIHLVERPEDAYPGEEPLGPETGRPTVAFFLAHALRELGAFAVSLETRIAQTADIAGRVLRVDDPDALLSDAFEPFSANASGTPRPDIANPLKLLRTVRLTILIPAIQAIATVARLAEGPMPFVRSSLVGLLDDYVDGMRGRIEEFIEGDVVARRVWELIDLLAANIRGIVASGLDGDADFSPLDEWNYLDWLRMNRISERTLKSPLVRGAHDLAFAYRDGNADDPQLAAGQALNGGCRFFFMYKGALFWRMKAGMGDVVFAPMYLALRKRGVKFRFFHRLDEIVLDDTQSAVRQLRFTRQVKLKPFGVNAGTNYQPLAMAGEMPCWPARPNVEEFAWDDATRARYDRLIADENTRDDVNFESASCRWTDASVVASVGPEPPDQHAGECVGHYDDVIVTVPVAALPGVSKALRSAPGEAGRRWGLMLDNIGTVATQSAQLWFNRKTSELGWTLGQVNFSAFVHPFDTWADLSHLIRVEGQPCIEEQRSGEGRQCVESLQYLCSVLPDQLVNYWNERWRQDEIEDRVVSDISDAAIARTLVKANVKTFLNESAFQLWPDAVHRYPKAFKWEFLFDADDKNRNVARREGVLRLDAQHLSANIDPSDRYTQSLPGTTQYRIRPDETGFQYLFVAGDWTDCGFNLGCVESAVMSGRLASSAIRGFPKKSQIPGLCEAAPMPAVTIGETDGAGR